MSEVKHEVLLQAKGIYKNFETSKKDQAVHALTNVDLTLYRGETLRSEERRVGKECRSRWSPYH